MMKIMAPFGAAAIAGYGIGIRVLMFAFKACYDEEGGSSAFGGYEDSVPGLELLLGGLDLVLELLQDDPLLRRRRGSAVRWYKAMA